MLIVIRLSFLFVLDIWWPISTNFSKLIEQQQKTKLKKRSFLWLCWSSFSMFWFVFSYRRLALKWHPDKNLTNKAQAEEKFKAISAKLMKFFLIVSRKKTLDVTCVYVEERGEEEQYEDTSERFEQFVDDFSMIKLVQRSSTANKQMKN